MGIRRGSNWISAGALSADYTSASFSGNGSKRARMQWSWAGTGTPNGNFYVQGSEDGTNWVNLKLPRAHVTTATHTDGAAAIAVNSATAGSVIAIVENPPALLRLAYVRTGGGTANASLSGVYDVVREK